MSSPDPPFPPPARPIPVARAVHRSMLSWWGVVPTIAFVFVELFYGMPRARARATSPDHAVSYLGGSHPWSDLGFHPDRLDRLSIEPQVTTRGDDCVFIGHDSRRIE